MRPRGTCAGSVSLFAVMVGRAELTIQRASSYIKHDITPAIANYNLHLVRSVAPNKEMYCLSFRLPEEVAFARD